MGNRQTNLNIDKFFEKDASSIDRVYRVAINTAIGKRFICINTETGATKLCMECKKLCYEWTPKSHMRDFEVTQPDSGDIHIARGQGIGVIIIDPSHYIKLMYDHKSPIGIKTAFISRWRKPTIQLCREVLSADLGIGYDVLMYFDGEWINLCEPEDHRDQRKTVILLKSCKKYASYDPLNPNKWKKHKLV